MENKEVKEEFKEECLRRKFKEAVEKMVENNEPEGVEQKKSG